MMNVLLRKRLCVTGVLYETLLKAWHRFVYIIGSLAMVEHMLPDGSFVLATSSDARFDSLMTDNITDGSSIGQSDLVKIYEQTAWGQYHAGQALRYSENFGYDRDTMLRDLGEDVHPVGHMRVTHNAVVALGIASLNDIDISPDEAVLARVSASLHDIGECEHPDIALLCGATLGDRPYGTKTSEDRQLESEIVTKIISVLFATLPDALQTAMVSVITHSADSAAHMLLETAHNWGFYSTALRAGRLTVDNTFKDDHRAMQLKALASTVSTKIRPQLEKATMTFPVLEQWLDATDSLYESIAA